MNNTKQAILVTLHRILVKGKRHYAVPSVDSLITLLSERHETTVGRRWLFQCVHDLIDLGYINRKQRYVKDADGLYRQIPSLLTITLKGARKLFSSGVAGASQLCKEILGWIKDGDKRWPEYKDRPATTPERSGPAGIYKMGDLIPGLLF